MIRALLKKAAVEKGLKSFFLMYEQNDLLIISFFQTELWHIFI